jgi:ankyrin repeat protein
MNYTDKDGNTPLWLSTYSSYHEITERLLAQKNIDVNLIRGRRRFEMPSTSLHHAATRLDTVLLRRLLTVPEVDPNLCVAGHSPISITVSRGSVSTVACLLSMGSLEINGRGFIDPPICQAATHGHHDMVRLLVQQGTRLNINKSTIVSHDTTLYIAARGGDLEIVQALLLHNQINANLRNEYFKDPLMLAVKDGHFLIVNALLANTRLKRFSLKRSLDLARDDCI